jgi:hypothetical protein
MPRLFLSRNIEGWGTARAGFPRIAGNSTCRPPSPSGAQEEARGEGKGCLICSVEQPCLYDLDAVSARLLCLAGC